MKRVTDKLNLTPVRTKNRWRRSVRYLILSLVISSAMASCISEDFGQGNPNTGDGKEKEVVFKVAVPGTAAPKPQLRSIGAEQENTIETVDVLAFRIDGGNEFFDYYSQAQRSSSADEGQSSQSFTVKVRIKTYEQRFVVITNAHTKVMELIGSTDWGQDTPKVDMLSRLTLTFGAEGDKWKVISASNFTAFPMWGESAKTTITGSTSTVGSVPMLRMIAKINVQLDETVTGLTDKFKVKSVHLYNTNTTGHIVPSTAASHWDETDHIALKATVPTGATRYLGPLAYADFSAPGLPDVAMKGAIYTFETQAVAQDKPLEATCIVVGGLYDTDTNPTHYRLDFFESDGKTYRDILRNHQYIANIIAVKGRGYPTEEEAFKAKAVNMVATILEWDEGGMGDIVFDGQFMLSVSQGEFSFSRDAKTGEEDNNVLHVFTDVQPSGWKIEKIVDAANTTPVTWLTLNPSTGLANAKTKVVLTFGDNNTPAERSANVIIAAGRLRYTVKVKQSLTPDIGINIMNPATSLPINELVFTAAVDVIPASQQFKINWAPKATAITVSNSSPGAYPFVATIDQPITGTIPGGTGTVTYNLQPTAITSAELTSNPFLEKITKVDYMVSNGIIYENKSIFLRQLVPNLIVNQSVSLYRLNNSSYTINVRSNSGWRIKSITETITQGAGSLLDLKSTDNLCEGTSGGYNTNLGTEITFSTANNGVGTVGKVTIVFECTDATRYFSDKTMELDMIGEYYPAPHTGWAGCNIYYDTSLGHLTFDGVGVQTHSTYQGVYFQWGSLYGISPMGAYSGTTILFPPSGGNATAASLGYSTWSTTPRYPDGEAINSNPPAGKTVRDRAFLYELDEYVNGIGDICKYMTEKGWVPEGKWRMPTSNEFNTNASYSAIGTVASTTPTNAYGQFIVSAYGLKTDIGSPKFVLSGRRTSATAPNSGTSSRYWSSSLMSTDTYRSSGFNLNVSGGVISMFDAGAYSTRTEGQPVRCVRE